MDIIKGAESVVIVLSLDQREDLLRGMGEMISAKRGMRETSDVRAESPSYALTS